MTLLADYQARYSTQLRTSWSNPQNSSATTPNTTNETQAAADAQADFEAVCGVVYSSSNTTHVAAAVPLVRSKLEVYMGTSDEAAYEKTLNRCRDIYRLVLGRNRINPTTDSVLNPTEETFNSTPFADSSNFDNFIGNSPNGDPYNGSGQSGMD